MPVIDLKPYLERKKENSIASAVAEVASNINQPGSVIQLKHHIYSWFSYSKELKSANS